MYTFDFLWQIIIVICSVAKSRQETRLFCNYHVVQQEIECQTFTIGSESFKELLFT